jgi:hypothetical protein
MHGAKIMYTVDRPFSLKLSRLSFVAAVMVVLQHAYAPYWSGTLEKVLCFGVVIWDVPYFFVVAGILLFKDYDGWSMSWYRCKVFGRIRTLLVPYVCWTIYGIVLGAIAVWIGLRPNTFHFNDISWWFSATGISEASMYAGHLWFIRRLFLFVLISPLIAWCANRIGWWLIPLFLVMYVFNFKSAATWSTLAFFYFGACCVIRSDQLIRQKIEKLGFAAVACFYAMMLYVRYMTMGADVLFVERCGELLAIGGGLMFVNMLYEQFISFFRFVDGVKQYSFLIYCAHYSLYQYIKATIKPVIPEGGALIAFLIGLLISILIAGGVKRFFPQLYAITSGGRGAK